MSPGILPACVLGYFALLLAVAAWTSRRANNEAFFAGGHRSPWMGPAQIKSKAMLGRGIGSGLCQPERLGQVEKDGQATRCCSWRW